jgi:2-oxoglutarate ferredoxin oxidoreductase subunit beta
LVGKFQGGTFATIELKKGDGTPEDEARHDPSDIDAAYRLANLEWPGRFGVFYEKHAPTKNEKEAGIVAAIRERNKNADDLTLLKRSFERMK